MTQNEQTILDLFAAWGRFDLDSSLGSITDDITYSEHPTFKSAHGREDVTIVWRGFLEKMRAYKVDVRNFLNGHDLVVVERTENFETVYGTTHEVSVTGVFEFRDGKIAAWRDYWDAMGVFPEYAAAQAALKNQ